MEIIERAMIEERDYETKRLRLIDYLVLFFLIWGYGNISNTIYRPILFIIGCLIALKLYPFLKKQVLKDKACLMYLLFLIYYACFIPIDQSPRLSLSYLGTYVLYFIPYLIYIYYTSYINKIVYIKKIYRYTFYYLVIIGVASIIYYYLNPGVARLHATHRSDLGGLMIGGGYQLAYVYALLLPVLTDKILRKEYRIKNIILYVFSVILLWKTNSLITLIAGMIGSVWCFINYGKTKDILLKRIITLIVILSLAIFINYIGELLIIVSADKNVTSYMDYDNSVYIRINEIGNFLKYGDLSQLEAFRLRYENFMLPIDSIINSPLLGNLFNKGICTENAVFSDSSIITAISCWGVPIAFLHLYPFFALARKYSSYSGTTIVFTLLMLFNPSEGFSSCSTVLFLIPALSYIKKHDT